MRAAMVTTAIVLVVLVAYSRYRESERRAQPAASAASDVASAPPQREDEPAVAPVPTAPPTASGGEASPVPPVPALPQAPADETPREASVGDKPKQYVVAPGDTLWSIARRYYRDGRFARAIYEANRDQIQRPNVLHPGQTLVLP